MDASFEERKNRYLLSVEEEYKPAEKQWWQNQPPSFRLTKEYAISHEEVITTHEPVSFRRNKKEWMAITVLVVVAGWLIYLLSKNHFSAAHVIFLLLVLLVVLPGLLKDEPLIRISEESIYLFREEKNILWRNIVGTYIKNTEEETPSYFMIVHYYDEGEDMFKKSELSLDGIVSPVLLSATVEAFRKS